MDLYSAILRPIAFRMEPERVHEIALSLIERGLLPGQSSPLVSDAVELFGVKFANRVGLAAGFDKNAVGVEQWHKFGFGHVEIGTVTWHAQEGNPRPRVFRLPDDKALINRMGFPNLGATAVAEKLAKSSPKIPVGVNLGKSKVTELDDAQNDYRQSYEVLQSLGDYFVVNVSSPNTPGLRTLQDREPLTRIFEALKTVNESKPMFVKVAPDLTEEALGEVLAVAVEMKLTGIIATNTTISRDVLPGVALPEGRHISNSLLGGGLSGTKGQARNRTTAEAGGLSGSPMLTKSNLTLEYLAQNAPNEMVLIGVGGVSSAADYRMKRDLGAQLVQLYTGWIYGGPGLVPKLLS